MAMRSTRSSCLLALLALLAIATAGQSLRVHAQTACGVNGRCSAAAECPSWSSQTTADECTDGAVCCQAPGCQSKTNGAFGTCGVAASCTTGRTESGLCGDESLQCCLPAATTAQSCQAQGQTGVCQTTTCPSGNSVNVEGLCSAAGASCCLPEAAPVAPTEQCQAQGQTGVCQTASCASGNSVTGLCKGGTSFRCCLPNPPPPTTCSAQGQLGQCGKVTECASGNTVSGLCPGDSTIRCCLPKPPNYGSCITSKGFVGSCTAAACAGTTHSGLCPGPAAVKCCVTSEAPPPPPPAQDYGKCFVASLNRAGTCQETALCGAEGGPVAGLCPGPNNIQCCPDGEELPSKVFAPAAPAAGTFFGACQGSAGAGTCKTSAACSDDSKTASSEAGLCSYAPSTAGVVCCLDGGPQYIDGVDLPGGRGAHVSSSTAGLAPSTAMSCFKGTGSAAGPASYVLARGWMARCQPDPTVVGVLGAAATSGLAADVLMTPAAWCGMSARAQAQALLASINGQSYGRVWVQALAGGGFSNFNFADNLAWILEATDALSAALGGARVGVMTSSAAWTAITNNLAAGNRLGALPLWYVGSNSDANFADFAPFAGWTFPTAKQFAATSTMCGLTVESSWMPSRSSSAAAAGSAPAAEPIGPACSSNGNNGTCQSIGACTGSTAAGVAACTANNADLVCCMTDPLVRPAPPAAEPLPITYGICKTGDSVGICQPSAFCGATDTRVANVTGCVGAEDDVDVLCCVPTTPVPMPPPDAPAVEVAPAEPASASASAKAFSKLGLFTPRHVRKAATTTAASSASNKVCVNKAGLELIESAEGFRSNFYLDAVGIKTIGYGTACHAYPCDTLRPPITRAQAERIMLADVTARYAPSVRNWIKVPLNSNQFSALTSFVYNVGEGGLKGSLGTALNSGCYSCVRAKLMQWVKAKGVTLPGLVTRRAAEADLFENPKISPCLDGSGDTGSSEGQSWGACTFQSKKGDCIDVDDCEGTFASGLCAGPSNVKCCLDQPPNPPTPAPTACGNGGTCKAATSCNTGTHILRSGLCPGDSTIKCCQPKSAAAGDGWWEGATRDPLGGSESRMPTTVPWEGKTVEVKSKIVLHTTEGGSYEGARSTYSNTQPHFTVTFQRGFFQAFQHISINNAGKALKHPYAGVETNKGGAIQIEIVGSATKVTQLSAKYLDGIASLVRWISAEKGVAKRAAKFLPYPASYGNNAYRMKGAAWLGFSGVCGHQHVPDNSHGDPGDINIAYILGSDGTVAPPLDPAGSTGNQPGTNGNPGDFGKCTSEGRTGICQEKSSCGGTVLSGLCAGPSNVACCMENFGSCSVAASGSTPARNGQCQESSTCKGTKVAGKCPGPASVTCCLPEYGSCAKGTATGTCMATSQCKGTVATGLCAGPADVACCLPTKPVDFGTCTVPYEVGDVTGQCVSKSSCQAPHVSTPGRCSGPADIACCHQPVPVRTYAPCGVNGQCQDTATCTGTVKRGLCPGASNIACCEHSARPKAALSAPLNTPRALFAPEVTVNGTTTFGELPPEWSAQQLTLCEAGGKQGFCMDGSIGGAVCNGVVTYPSTCQEPALCCTPQSCQLSNTTSGICIPPTECRNQAGYVTEGYCGVNGGPDGTTSCCTGAGVAMCDTAGLLACLLADGEPSLCAASYNCPPLPDYDHFAASVQAAPAAGPLAHGENVTSPDAFPDDGNLNAAGGLAPSAIVAALLALASLIATVIMS